MSSLVPKKKYNCSSADDDDDLEAEKASRRVSRQIYLKPVLNKEVALQRIRHRKRTNKFQAAVQAFFGSFSTNSKYDDLDKKWVDDAFAAP